ncbi:MAG: hypothetical protein ABL949_00755 [Fimbriimonadaceae bacterium]
MKSLRYGWLGMLLLGSAMAAAAFNPVGVWKPGLQHGKLSAAAAKKIKQQKAVISAGSFKINKDKTFGLSLAGRVMLGTWTLKGDVLSITVKEILGKQASDVAKMPSSERMGQFKMLKDGTMMSLPDHGPGEPRIMWRKSKA